MMWALIEGNAVVETTAIDPKDRYSPSMLWVHCPDTVKERDLFNADAQTFTSSGAAAVAPTLSDSLVALAQQRYQHQIQGVPYKGAIAASDPVSINMITASYVAAVNGLWQEGTPWKMADGSFVAFSVDDMKVLAQKVLKYIAACYAYEARLAAQLKTNLNTDITVGWPSP